LNDTERAIKHFSAAASCRRRAMFSSEPAASLACGRNVTLSNCPAGIEIFSDLGFASLGLRHFVDGAF